MEITFEDISEAVKEIEDFRRQSGNFRHPLDTILFTAISAMACGLVDFEEMEEFGKIRKEFLSKYVDIPNGIPDSDTFRRVFERLDPKNLAEAVNKYLASKSDSGGRIINIDGKSIRGAGQKDGKNTVHIVSAWFKDQLLSLGEVKVSEKSNEITAVPELLDMPDIKGDIITADAMSCQKAIVEKIKKKKGGYVIALKKNQPEMARETEEYFKWQDSIKKTDKNYAMTIYECPVEKNHGRTEQKTVSVVKADWFESKDEWKGLKYFVREQKKGTRNGKEFESARYFIASIESTPERFSQIIRQHWSIENDLHWTLDVIFGEDKCQAKKDNSAQSLNVLRKLVLSKIRSAEIFRGKKKLPAGLKQLRAMADPDFMLKLLGFVL